MAVEFDREIDFEYGEVADVSPRVRRIIARNPGPFTYTGTGTYLIGRGQVAVIDPGPDDETHLEALLAALEGETVSHILVTHTHRDHSPLAARLKEITGAESHAFGPHGVSARADGGDIRLDASGDTAFRPDREVRHGDVIEGPDWTVECVFTPGHTSNHMAFALREEKALFSGDHVMAWSTSVIAPPDGHMGDYMASLRLLLERDDEIFWPTHGPPVRRPKPFVRGFISHRRAREQAILNRLAVGERTIAGIVPRIYADVDPGLHPAAAMSTLAHMQHLVERGEVETDGEPAMDSEYRLKR